MALKIQDQNENLFSSLTTFVLYLNQYQGANSRLSGDSVSPVTEVSAWKRGLQSDVIADLRHHGAGLRQLVRLTGISYGILRRMK